MCCRDRVALTQRLRLGQLQKEPYAALESRMERGGKVFSLLHMYGILNSKSSPPARISLKKTDDLGVLLASLAASLGAGGTSDAVPCGQTAALNSVPL